MFHFDGGSNILAILANLRKRNKPLRIKKIIYNLIKQHLLFSQFIFFLVRFETLIMLYSLSMDVFGK